MEKEEEKERMRRMRQMRRRRRGQRGWDGNEEEGARGREISGGRKGGGIQKEN